MPLIMSNTTYANHQHRAELNLPCQLNHHIDAIATTATAIPAIPIELSIYYRAILRNGTCCQPLTTCVSTTAERSWHGYMPAQ